MRSKLFKIYMDKEKNPENWFWEFLIESKKRKYLITLDKENKMIGYSKDKKEIDPITNEYEYFLIYDPGELRNCGCEKCQKKLKRMGLT